MAEILKRHVFTKDDWLGVQGFNCGDEPHEVEVADWLKGQDDPTVDSALTSISHPDRSAAISSLVRSRGLGLVPR